MRAFTASPRRRVVTAAVAVLVAVAGVAVFAGRARAAPQLPTVSAQQLIASSLEALSKGPSVSGTAAATVDLGLPSLPSNGPDAATGLLGLLVSLQGDHSLEVWSSPDGMRVTDLQPAAERSIYVSKTDAWGWDSSSWTAYRLPAPSPPTGTPPTLDPVTLAQRFLAAVTPTTDVSVQGSAWVANRAAYELDLRPTSPGTLVGEVAIFIDAQTRIPLGVQVTARGATSPSLSSEFTGVSFAPIDPSTYAFTPPPGAKVVDVSSLPSGSPSGSVGTVRTFGSAWDTVVAVEIPPLSTIEGQLGPGGSALGAMLPLSAPLYSVNVVDRGNHAWLLAGMMPLSSLAAVAPQLP